MEDVLMQCYLVSYFGASEDLNASWKVRKKLRQRNMSQASYK